MTVVRVLLVDDQAPFLRAMSAWSRRPTGSRSSARPRSGEESLLAAAELLPDLVLMDVNLPGIDGLEATQAAAASAPSPPVVLLLSTYDEDAGAHFVAESGAAAYVTKSAFGPDRLLAGVEGRVYVNHGSRWRATSGHDTAGARAARRPDLDEGLAVSAGCRYRPARCLDPVAHVAQGEAAAIGATDGQVQLVAVHGQDHGDGVVEGTRRLGHAEVGRRLDAWVEAQARCAESSTVRRPVESGRASSEPSAVGRPERASWAGNTPRVISRSDCMAVFVDVEERCELRGVRARGDRRGSDGDSSRSRPGSGARCGITCRAIARSTRLRSASPALISRARDWSSSWVCMLSRSTSAESSAVSWALRKAIPAWSARSASSRWSRGRSGCPAGSSTVMLPSRSPWSTTGISTLGGAGVLQRRTGASAATRSGPASTWTDTATTRLAFTACAAASATAGNRADGSGLSPSCRLKSASASYGAAAAPNASRSASRTTRRRSGWNAIATRAVAISDGQKPPAPPPTAEPTDHDHGARSRSPPARLPGPPSVPG